MKKLIKRFKGGQLGFTLIELLVVIAILGILAAVIVPNVSKYIGSGQTAANATEKALVQNAVAAAMADAQVTTFPAGTLSSGGDITLTGKKTVKVGDYFTSGSLSSLVQKYSVDVSGLVTVVP